MQFGQRLMVFTSQELSEHVACQMLLSKRFDPVTFPGCLSAQQKMSPDARPAPETHLEIRDESPSVLVRILQTAADHDTHCFHYI